MGEPMGFAVRYPIGAPTRFVMDFAMNQSIHGYHPMEWDHRKAQPTPHTMDGKYYLPWMGYSMGHLMGWPMGLHFSDGVSLGTLSPMGHPVGIYVHVGCPMA